MIVHMRHGRARAFAGEDMEKAKYSPEDRDFLREFEPTVVHYKVMGMEVPEAFLHAAGLA